MVMAQDQYSGAIRPTLFIGLGGTGKEVLLRLRRKFYERLGTPGLPCTAYLWLDTDTRDVMAQGEKINEIYQSVAFEPHEKIGLLEGSVGSDLSNIFRNKDEWRHLHKWLYPEVERYGAEITDGAGGVRAVGRLTFFYHFENTISPLVRNALGGIATQGTINATLQLFRDRKMKTPLFPPNPIPQVFVVSSLAGGTGCGTVLDTIFFLRQLSQSAGIPIERFVGILFMPNVFYMSARDEVSQRSYGNAYAALKELEFYTLRLNEQQDLSVDYVVEWDRDRLQRIQGPPFSIAYIEEMINEGGIGLEPDDRAEIFSMVAESLMLDFMPGAFSTQKRSQYSNIVQYLTSVQGSNISSGGVTLPQEFARRYASFGMSKIEIPLDTLKAAAAARLSHDVLEHVNRDSNDPYIKTNVLDDMAQRQVDARGLEDRFGSAWKESIRKGVAAIFDGFTVQEADHVNELEARIKQFEDKYVYSLGNDATKWGAAVDLIKKSTPTVTHAVGQSLSEWIDDTLEREARGMKSLLADDGYLRYMTENLRELYAPRGEGSRAVYDELIDEAQRDAEAYAKKRQFLLRDLREAVKSWGVSVLMVKPWTVSKYLERLREAEEQYALAEASRVLYGETKKAAEAAVKFLSEQRPTIDGFALAAAALQRTFIEKYQEFVNFGEQVLFIRIFDHGRDWGAFYRLDVDENGQQKVVNPQSEYRRFMGKNFGGNATLSNLIELFGRKTIKEVSSRLSRFSEERFWSDFEANPRPVSVLEHPQMRTHWSENIDRLIRSAMPMIRRQATLGGKALQIQRRAFLGVGELEGPVYESFIDEVRQRLIGLGYIVQDISVQPTEKPWEVYLYLVSYAFPLPALPIVTTDCHKAYFDFHQALRYAQIGEKRYHIPLHLSTAWEGKFEDLEVYTDEQARQVKEAREVVLFGSILKVLNTKEAQERIEYGYKLGAPFFRLNPLGAKREAIEALRNNEELRQTLLQAIERREREINPKQLKAYYWIIQYLLFSGEYSMGSPEHKLLDDRLKRVNNELIVQHNVPEAELSFDGQPESRYVATAKERAGDNVDWVGPVPVLHELEAWAKPSN